MDHATIIRALGGPSAVALLLDRHHSRPVRWQIRGIPREHWPDLIQAAAAAGREDITLEALLAGEPERVVGS